MSEELRLIRRAGNGPRDFFVASVVVAGAAALVAWSTVAVASHVGALAWALAGLLLVSEVRPIQRAAREGELTASWAFAGALAYVADPVFALIVLAMASMVGDLLGRKTAGRIGFNAATLVLSLSAGIVVLRVFDAESILTSSDAVPPWFVAAAVGFAMAVVAVNIALMVVVTRLDRGTSISSILRAALPQAAVDDLLLLGLAPVVAVAGMRSTPMLVLPLVAVVAVHHSAELAAESRIRASRDVLTGLPNRTNFMSAVEAAVPAGATLVMIDLDGFKTINDRLGHSAGDRALEIVAKRLLAAVRPTDVVARIGGDEFSVLLERTSSGDADVVVERIRAQFEQPIEIGGVPVPVGATLGVAHAPSDGVTAVELMEYADSEMLSAKRATGRDGRSRVASDNSFGSRLEMLRNLRSALDDGALAVHYQPQVDLRTGAVAGVEALVRWTHPELGAVAPSEFVAAAEHTELIGPLTDFVLERALETCHSWWSPGSRIRVAVNVSARSLEDPRFVDAVAHRLRQAGLPGEALEIEITESALLIDTRGARKALVDLHAMGVTVAIDDFGTGFSSLEHLRTLPIEQLKIDRTFVQGLGSSLDERFLAPMIDLAHNLGLTVVAEGVENVVVADLLASLGCDVGQGWHFAPAFDAADLVAWLDATPAVASDP